jgi:UPF0271 protein
LKTIDLNSDLGELPAQRAVDLELMDIVTSANIACGGHAGDEQSMREMVRAAVERRVAIGAHPSYPDRPGFGRVEIAMGERELEEAVRAQLESLVRIAREIGARVVHVKPHGALYHAAMHSRGVAEAVGRAVRSVDSALALMGQAGATGLEWWQGMGMRVVAEGFADRVYLADGTLSPRSRPGALIEDTVKAAQQALRIARGQGVVASDGTVVRVAAQTICIHSDTPGAVPVARAVRTELEKAGFAVRALG